IHYRNAPLRERREDIPLLFGLFFKGICRKMQFDSPCIDPRVIPYFRQYDWPGNVRELQNVVERIVNLANGQDIRLEHLPEEILTPHQSELPIENLTFSVNGTGAIEEIRIRELLDKNERNEITKELIGANGNLSQVARVMGISRNTLYKKLKKLKISI
ncbi:MAG TPA: sigma-54-dependent Fis family transcriptional regulator, partial [Desulfosporosinus sp.]|nr:sigma-54-dependent Fis family transcriptional regulator [Desulfosporosinus sp.]